MEFAEELYIGRSIINVGVVVKMLKKGDIPHGVFCVCSNENGKYRYEIMSSHELLKERNALNYKVLGIAAGKREAFEVVRSIVEESHEFV